MNNGTLRPDPADPPSPDRRDGDAAELTRLKHEIAQRDDILSLAAHELRNPLHALSLHLALARATAQSGAPADAAARIARAEATLKRYSERVTVLMELLASPGAVYPLSPRRVDIVTLLATLVDSLEQEARSRAIDLQLISPPGFDPWREVDAVALEQVADNLLLNAFKHSAANTVRLRLVDDPGGWGFQVEDNGGGIAHEDQKAIFGKCVVAKQSHRGAGTGLGLWIVTRLLQAMGGRMDLESAPGAGSVFKVRIPSST